MSPTLIALILVAALALWMMRVNARYAAKQRAEAASDDARVAEAWDEFGLPDEADAFRPTIDALLAAIKVDALKNKLSTVRLGVMAARVGRHDVLPTLAARAEELGGGGCGETAGLALLAAAYAGDREKAKEVAIRSSATLSGCSSCSSSAEVRILMQEVQLALDALEDRALSAGGRASASRPEDAA